jgi:hypothetical protein
MRKVKMAAAHEGKTVKEFLVELAEGRIQELERKGSCRRARNLTHLSNYSIIKPLEKPSRSWSGSMMIKNERLV